MYLSKLEIFGFKSFARKTSFSFHNGITSVVGPNGCGKSNIVDAIRWVLGEQKAGVLRSERMENVIFNGSKTQKPLGMAEVALTIQNTKNILPIEYSEVVITRRLFRSGESQYLLNNAVCRLKDIMDLFMDTGMGPNAYSVIELSMVEQILNGKAEERRHIFEEAAGVGKYKARRKAAYRKLEATEADLLRLSDILSEVEKSVDSLKRQVQKAERYQNYAEELKTADLLLASHKFILYKNEWEPLVEESKALHDRREKLSAQLATEEAAIEELQLQLLEMEKQLVARQRELNANTERIQKKEESILINTERMRAAQENRMRFSREIIELGKRNDMLAEMAATLGHRLDEMRLEVERAEAEHARRQRELAPQREASQAKRQEWRDLEARRSGEAEAMAQLQKEAERLRTQSEYSAQRRQQLAREQQALQAQKHELEARRSALALEVAQALARLDQMQAQNENLQEQILARQNAVAELKQRILDLTGDRQRHGDRASLLRQFMESYEDYPAGVKYLWRDGALAEGCMGTLGEKIVVAKEYRRAIEAALGETVVALVVDHEDRAFDGIAILRESAKGTAAFLAMANGRASGYRAPHNGGVPDARIVARASELVQCPQELRPVVEALLEDCFLVGSLEAARALAEQESNARRRFLTPAGEVISNWGFVRGGAAENEGHAVIGRREEIEALENEKERLDQEIDALITARERAERELQDLQKEWETLAQNRKALEKDRQQLEIEFGQAAFRAGKAEEEWRQRAEELQRLETAHQEFTAALAGLQPRLEESAGLRQAAESAYAQLASEIESLEHALRQAEQVANAAQIKAVEARANLRNLEAERERGEASRKEVADSIQYRTQQIAEAETQEKSLAGHIQEIRAQLQDDFAERKELEEIVQELERVFREEKSGVEAKEKALRPLRAQREEVSERLHQVELRAAELAMLRDNLIKMIQETYEIDLAQHLAAHPPDLSQEFDLPATEERVGWLRNRLKSMGPVNMLALEEYQKEKERFDFLTAQKEDLLKAEENLKETIKVINDTAYERFGKTFSQIRENFIQVFKSFFEGGVADLRLAEGDPLEADIVIEANPKGRSLGSLALLSGGEKTLTAISLLFAIYLVKPSPFCILDEVDAPLDDNNIGRFTGALRKFSENTQFICVTHNKGTMKAADFLYGVTMEEQGVSKVVSVKFEEADIGKLTGNGAPAAEPAVMLN